MCVCVCVFVCCERVNEQIFSVAIFQLEHPSRDVVIPIKQAAHCLDGDLPKYTDRLLLVKL